MNINSMAFVENLPYMGKGMFWILVVIGVIILITMLLNRMTAGEEE